MRRRYDCTPFGKFWANKPRDWMASTTKVMGSTALYDLIEAGEMGALQMHEADLTALHPEHKITPLHMLIGAVVRHSSPRDRKKLNSIMDTVKWMLDRGADPREEAPHDSPFILSLVKSVEVPAAFDDDTQFHHHGFDDS